jgi:transposase
MSILYVGLDIHKKTIAVCAMRENGEVVIEETIDANRLELRAWAERQTTPWKGVMEATIFTGWIYDFLRPYALELKVGNPLRLKAISSGKHKNDRLDARTLANLLRCDLVPEVCMLPKEIRELRRLLRYRNLLVREAVRFQNRTTGLLMETGTEYRSKDVRGFKAFNAFVDNLKDVPKSVIAMLKISGSNRRLFTQLQRKIVRSLQKNRLICERVELLMTIPGVGVIVALTWVLEVGDPNRFKNRDQAVSYCGLCSGEKSSGGKDYRGPISKQRNEHLQPILIEAAKLAPRYNEQLAKEYEKVCRKGHKNTATIAVARKMVSFMLAVDKSGQPWKPAGMEESL